MRPSKSSLTDCTEDILNALKSKNPQVKEGTLRFLNRCLKNTREAPSKDSIKPLSDALSICTGDSSEPVRSASAESLGLLMKILGERQFAPVLEGLDDIRKAKVREFFENAEVKFKAGAAAGGRSAPSGPPVPPKNSASVKKVRSATQSIQVEQAADPSDPYCSVVARSQAPTGC